jgi:hypothetical protein
MATWGRHLLEKDGPAHSGSLKLTFEGSGGVEANLEIEACGPPLEQII